MFDGILIYGVAILAILECISICIIIKVFTKKIRQLDEKVSDNVKKDFSEKYEMQFISDISHELKTPISLIQGYAEGLLENVNNDEENKNFYSEVILDEANKMDKLVKKLLELTKLEYDDKNFDNKNFDIVELIKEVIRSWEVKIEEENIEVIFDEIEPIYVFADDFYIEQVVNNYFSNSMKNVCERNGKKQIKIIINKSEEQGKMRITIFNTGEHINEEHLDKIWNRFYKADESRERAKGGTGIGLSIVKAIMNRYKNKFGVQNVEDGVEFYFELAYSCISAEM